MAAKDTDKVRCSHNGCEVTMNAKNGPQPGWTVVRVETYSLNNIRHYYLYLCSKHTITTKDKQRDLFT